jgi:hypothetical protein
MFANRESWIEVFRRRAVGCNLETADGETLTNPNDVVERFDDLDLRLGFLVNNSLAIATDHLATLGKATRLALSGAVGPAMTTTTAPNSTTNRIGQPE